MYRLTDTSSVVRIEDGALIPADEGNTDYQQYLQWFADGNTPQPYTPGDAWRVAMTADLKDRRDKLVNVLDGLMADQMLLGNTAAATIIYTAKQALKDVPANPLFTAARTPEEFKLAAKSIYSGIVAAAPSSIAAEFARYIGG